MRTASYGPLIRGKMREKCLTQRHVGQLLGIDQSSLSRKIDGLLTFTVEERRILARLLDSPEILATVDPEPDSAVAARDRVLIQQAVGDALEQLTAHERRAFSLAMALTLAGLLPKDHRHVLGQLFALAEFDTRMDLHDTREVRPIQDTKREAEPCRTMVETSMPDDWGFA